MNDNLIHFRPDVVSIREALRAADLNLLDLESVVIYAKRKAGDRVVWASGSMEHRKALIKALSIAQRELTI